MKTYYAVPEYFAKKKFPELLGGIQKIHPNVAYKYAYPSTEDLAKALGLINFDTALPQVWVDSFKEKTGFNPVLNFVWCYDDGTHWGYPQPITIEGETAHRICKHLENRK